MEIKFICTFWGKENLKPAEFIHMAREAGYDGVELNVPDDTEFVNDLKTTIDDDLSLIAQQWLPPKLEKFEEYRLRMLNYLRRISMLDPEFINSHTGKDYFSFEENCLLIEDCFDLSSETGVDIIHETHRGRFAFHANSLLPYLEKYERLRLNADFSHFCVASESLLEDQEDILAKILPRCTYIHARIGSDQAAQVNNPFAPEWSQNLEVFTAWWQKILDSARNSGQEIFYICPEFGPFPYMPQTPFTREPLSNQWEINIQVMDFLKEKIR